MILVSGILADEMIELMCARLKAMACEYVFLDQLKLPKHRGLTWQFCGGRITGYVTDGSSEVPVERIRGVYARYCDYTGAVIPDGLTAAEFEHVKAECQAATMSLFENLPCTVVNRVRASTSNDSKLYQAMIARSLGFRTPRTLATSDPDSAAVFYKACDRRVIYKSISGVRSIVRLLTYDQVDNFEKLRNCPSQFQEYIDGVNVRVHTVGQQVFATEILSHTVDYRYPSEEDQEGIMMQPIDLNKEMGQACVKLAQTLGLPVAGIDLLRTANGHYYCLEVNPSPGFLFYERATGQEISRAVAQLLMGM